MKVNLERGLTRLYLVGWALWLLFVLARLYVLDTVGGWPIEASLVAVLGIVFPALLFYALKWAVAGFRLLGQSDA